MPRKNTDRSWSGKSNRPAATIQQVEVVNGINDPLGPSSRNDAKEGTERLRRKLAGQAMYRPAPDRVRRAQTNFLINLFTWVGKTLRVCSRLLCFGGGLLKRRLPPEAFFRTMGFRAFAGTMGALTGRSCAGAGRLGT